MKLKHHGQLKSVVMMAFFITIMSILPLPENSRLSVRNGMIGIPTASASKHLGILGRTAPELELETWIDGTGAEVEPIRLRDYRGKVVYLYFFQDW